MSLPGHPGGHARERGTLVIALLLLTVWGVNFSVIKLLLLSLSPMAFLFARYIVTPLCAALTLLVLHGWHWPRLTAPEWRTLAWLSFLGHVVHVTLITWGIQLSSAFSTALIMACGPLMTLLILAVWHAERLGRWQVAGALLACAGILCFMADKFGIGWRAGLGDLVLLAAVLSFSVHTVQAREIILRRGPVLVMAYSTLLACPALMLITGAAGLDTHWAALPTPVWWGLAWALVISSFTGWIVWGWVNQGLGVARTAPLMYLLPPIAGVAGWLITGESFAPLKLFGAAVALIGVGLVQFGPAGARAARRARP